MNSTASSPLAVCERYQRHQSNSILYVYRYTQVYTHKVHHVFRTSRGLLQTTQDPQACNALGRVTEAIYWKEEVVVSFMLGREQILESGKG